MRLRAGAITLAALAGLAGGCGGQRQDAHEPSGRFRVEVVEASFPAHQHIAQPVTLRIRVRNTDSRSLPNVAVTVQTAPALPHQAPAAFGQDQQDPRLADPVRPIWILDRGPVGADTAYTNTWALGELPPGRTREFVWRLVAARAGAYTIGYRVSPGLYGKARPARGRIAGAFRIKIDNSPVAAHVNARGEVVRGSP